MLAGSARAARAKPSAAPGFAADHVAVRIRIPIIEGKLSDPHLFAGPAPAPASGRPSGYTASALDGSGRVLASAALTMEVLHSDGVPDIPVVVGSLPMLASTQTVGVSGASGATVLKLNRPATAPEIRLAGIRRHVVVGRRGLKVHWRTRASSGAALRSALDYSIDNGHTWKTVYSGDATGGVRLPAILLPGSRQARLRLRVSDGFSDRQVISPRFTSLGSPPRATIFMGTGFADRGVSAFNARAVDDLGRQLPGRRLRWFLDRRSIGRGTLVKLNSLPPGRHHLTLVATDSQGRSARLVRRITVSSTRPVLSYLAHASRIGRHVRVVTLVLASNVGARAVVTGPGVRRVSFTLGPRRRRQRIFLTRVRGPVRLLLVLRHGSSRTTAEMLIDRG